MKEMEDYVVGNQKAHDEYPYEQFISEYLKEKQTILEYGCATGYLLKRFQQPGQKMIGVDINAKGLEYAKELNPDFMFILNDGVSLKEIDSNTIDGAYSMHCFQHISPYSIRMNILRELYRVLKDGGKLVFQMGFGPGAAPTPYHGNPYDVQTTNGYADVRIDNPHYVLADLYDMGFRKLSYAIAPKIDGDGACAAWIFVFAEKNTNML
jgi:SAM-dependent methyltransferase